MKTAEELFKNHTLSNRAYDDTPLLDFEDFTKALTEHDREKDRDFLDTLNSPGCKYISKIKIIKLIDDMIEKNKEHFDDRNVCWLCYEDDYCEHKPKIEALTELKSEIQQGG